MMTRFNAPVVRIRPNLKLFKGFPNLFPYLIVTVDRNGDIFLNDTRIESADKELLKRRISEARIGYSKQKGKRDSLIIRMDIQAPNDRLIALLSIAKEMDLNAIIMTKSPENTVETTTIKEE